MLLKHFVKPSTEVADEEVAYLRDHPDEIDEITAEVNIHKFFLVEGEFYDLRLTSFQKHDSRQAGISGLATAQHQLSHANLTKRLFGEFISGT